MSRATRLAAFFGVAARALRRAEENPLRRRLLIGCVAAVAGQAVDAYSDGSWQFGAPSLFLWLLLGLGMAAAGLGEQEEQTPGNEAGQGTAQTGAAAKGAVKGAAGLNARLRFAGPCVFCAVLLSLIVRASR